MCLYAACISGVISNITAPIPAHLIHPPGAYANARSLQATPRSVHTLLSNLTAPHLAQDNTHSTVYAIEPPLLQNSFLPHQPFMGLGLPLRPSPFTFRPTHKPSTNMQTPMIYFPFFPLPSRHGIAEVNARMIRS